MRTPVLFWTVFVLAGFGAFGLYQAIGPEADQPAPCTMETTWGDLPAGMIEGTGPVVEDDAGVYLEIPMPYDVAAALEIGSPGQVRVNGHPRTFVARFG